MKKIMLLLLSLWVGSNVYAQNKFEKGYIIFENGTRIDCLLKNRNWQNTPTEFEYKKNANSNVEIGRLGSIQEFSIPSVFKYVKFRVQIDRSSEKEALLSRTRKPEFKEETLFLKMIVDSEMSLYSYKEEGLLRFFYQSSSKNPKQLIYKDYRNDLGQVMVNQSYKAQLKRYINCGNQKVNNVSYSTSNLGKYFVVYNSCKFNNVTPTDYTVNEKKGIFTVSLVGGFGNATATIDDRSFGSFTTINGEIGSKVTPKFGLQFEYLLPFDSYNWSIFAMPVYQSYSKTNTISEGDVVVTSETYEVNYKSIEMPIGVRRYFALTNTSRLFIDAAYVIDIPYSSKVITAGTRFSDEDISSGAGLSFAFGYRFQKKYGLELRYNANRNILSNEVFRDLNYSSISVLLSYKLL